MSPRGRQMASQVESVPSSSTGFYPVHFTGLAPVERYWIPRAGLELRLLQGQRKALCGTNSALAGVETKVWGERSMRV